MSMLPGERLKASDQKAWDTRCPASWRSLRSGAPAPLFGRGFAIQEAGGKSAEVGYGFHHNAYTSTLAQTGSIGFVGVLTAVWGPVFVGMKLIKHGKGNRAAMLIGATGIVAGVQQSVLGMATASFNGYRMAMMIGMVAGICYKVRDMQLTAAASKPNSATAGLHNDGYPVVLNDMLPIPDFDDQGRPIGYPSHPSYN